MWIGNGGIANVHVVNAVVDQDSVTAARRFSWWLGAHRDCEMVRKLDKLGCRASHTAELKFDGVRVPAENLLGGQDKLDAQIREGPRGDRGRKASGSATLGTFEQTRPMVAAQALGIARAALEYVTAYANRREAFGGPIIDHQGMAFPARRSGDAHRRRAPPDLARVVDGGQRGGVRAW